MATILLIITGSIIFITLPALAPARVLKEWYYEGMDNHLHITYFFIVTCAGLHLHKNPAAIFWYCLLMFAVAGIGEMLQSFIPGRDANWKDFAGSSLGVISGLTATILFIKLKRRFSIKAIQPITKRSRKRGPFTAR